MQILLNINLQQMLLFLDRQETPFLTKQVAALIFYQYQSFERLVENLDKQSNSAQTRLRTNKLQNRLRYQWGQPRLRHWISLQFIIDAIIINDLQYAPYFSLKRNQRILQDYYSLSYCCKSSICLQFVTCYIQNLRIAMNRVQSLLILLSLFAIITFCQRQTYLYQLLQVDEKATSDEIKKAFRRLSVKYHPDRNAGNDQIQKKYVEIKRAYQTLIDVSKRITYDLHGEAGLKQLQKTPLRKGGDFRTQMWVPLQKFYNGGEMVYSFRRGEICKNCKGTGDLSGQKHKCSVCGGTGKMIRQVKVKDTVKKMQMKCKECGGSGFGAKSKCPVCNGQKIIIAPRDLKFQLQKGMRAGDVVLFKGESEQGFDFYPGDVYVKLHEVPHPTLKRDGNSLKTDIDISLKEAILGFERRITHLDGHTVHIEEVQDIQDGKVLQIQNQGMPVRGDLDSYGKLLATININYKRFGPVELQKIKKIFEAGSASVDQDL